MLWQHLSTEGRGCSYGLILLMTIVGSSSSWVHPAVVTYFLSSTWQWVRTSWSIFSARSFTVLLGICVTSDTTQKKKAEFFLILPLLNAGVLEDLSQWMSVLCIYQFINLSGQFLKAPVNLHTRIWVGTLEYHSYSPLFVQRGFLSDVKSVIRLCLPPQVKDVMFLVLPLVGVLHTVNNFHRPEILRGKKKIDTKSRLAPEWTSWVTSFWRYFCIYI